MSTNAWVIAYSTKKYPVHLRAVEINWIELNYRIQTLPADSWFAGQGDVELVLVAQVQDDGRRDLPPLVHLAHGVVAAAAGDWEAGDRGGQQGEKEEAAELRVHFAGVFLSGSGWNERRESKRFCLKRNRQKELGKRRY